MTKPDPMLAELERIETELASQNETFDALRDALDALGNAAVAVSAADLEAIADACDVRTVSAPTKGPTGIRC